jgi:hypothetical protein
MACYVSRDVIFDENIFLFINLHSNAGSRLRSEISLLPCVLLNPTYPDQRVEVPANDDSNPDANNSGEDCGENDAGTHETQDGNTVALGSRIKADSGASAGAVGADPGGVSMLDFGTAGQTQQTDQPQIPEPQVHTRATANGSASNPGAAGAHACNTDDSSQSRNTIPGRHGTRRGGCWGSTCRAAT